MYGNRRQLALIILFMAGAALGRFTSISLLLIFIPILVVWFFSYDINSYETKNRKEQSNELRCR